MTYPKNVLAIDLSHWNEVTSWQAIRRAGVVGVIHKFSEGTSYRDPTYGARREAAKRAGLLWGRYHFANNTDVKRQIANAMEYWQPDELIALDWEDTDGTMSLAQAEGYATTVYSMTGRWPVLYSGNTAKERITGTTTLTACRLWLAHYANQPVCPPGWTAPWLWQWSQTGSLEGIAGDVDTDAYDGPKDQLAAEWTGKSAPPLPTWRPDAKPEMETTVITITAPKGSKIEVKTVP